ncbi:unnamed protein product [Thlaspi arvense]|uniref:Uncharacterized protein n=1 Tax=Thlaspi arvense TaxID=13288 RepID=A0AAU9RDN0_THLAR|nr:unnamed protein product [Thlaspi arvense]
MSQYNHNQSAGANSPPTMSTGPAPQPPIGYPTSDPSHGSVAPVKVETKSKVLRPCVAVVPWTSASKELQ